MSDWLELSQLIIAVQHENEYKVKHIFYNIDFILLNQNEKYKFATNSFNIKIT